MVLVNLTIIFSFRRTSDIVLKGPVWNDEYGNLTAITVAHLVIIFCLTYNRSFDILIETITYKSILLSLIYKAS